MAAPAREASGEAAASALARAAGDAGDPARAASDAARHCHNCGATAGGNYCPQCGQEADLALPSAAAFLRDAAGRYVRFDGRMWRSLAALLFRPGFLTREYLAGRRRRYVRPARLFVVLSIVLFAVLRFTGGTSLLIDTSNDANRKPGMTPGAQADERGVRVDPDFDVDLGPAAAPAVALLRGRFEAFNRLSREEKSEQLRAGILRYGPYAAIGLLPLFALLLKLVYTGSGRRHPQRPRRYAAHLVFGAHIHAFLFLGAMLMAVIGFALLRTALGCWMAVYAALALKSVYGGGWPGIVLRCGVIAVAYLFLFAVAVAALVVAAVILR